MVAAFRENRSDVDGGAFPGDGNCVGIVDGEFERFLRGVSGGGTSKQAENGS